MLISYRHKFIFIKTHKTASTSVEGLLEPYCAPEGHQPKHWQPEIRSETGFIAARPQGPDVKTIGPHASAKEIQNYLGKDKFASYLKIYTIRNPYDKVVSWFWHVMPADARNRLDGDFAQTRTLFRDWIRMRPRLPTDRQYYTVNGKYFSAKSIRYEKLSEDLMAIAQQLDLPIDLSRMPSWKTKKRRDEKAGFQTYYDHETAKVVENEFALDFELFGYEKL